MKLYASSYKHTLNFKFDAGTSRGVLKSRATYYIKLALVSDFSTFGVGEASPLDGLSIDHIPTFGLEVQKIIDEINGKWTIEMLKADLTDVKWERLPALKFALETALMDLENGGKRMLFQNKFAEGSAKIPINGLVWMGDQTFMKHQIAQKLDAGFTTLKMKVGAIDFESEKSLLAGIRKNFSIQELTLRVDANGAFTPENALQKLDELAKYDLHSIEQPIAVNQWEEMRTLCQKSPIPIALDEELIGLYQSKQTEMLDFIEPQFLIFKPTLLGGLAVTNQWIEHCEDRNIPWWMTSALESNIGLNAIAQYAADKEVLMPQGLGTGQLYHNNIPSPLTVAKGNIFIDKAQKWDLSLID